MYNEKENALIRKRQSLLRFITVLWFGGFLSAVRNSTVRSLGELRSRLIPLAWRNPQAIRLFNDDPVLLSGVRVERDSFRGISNWGIALDELGGIILRVISVAVNR